MGSENLMGKRVELVVHLKDQYLRLRRGDRGIVTGQFHDGFNVPLRVLWDNGTNWSVHYDEVQLVDDADRGARTSRAAARVSAS